MPAVEPRRPVAYVVLEFRFRLLRVEYCRGGSAALLTVAVPTVVVVVLVFVHLVCPFQRTVVVVSYAPIIHILST